MSSVLLFLYGSLKRGMPANHLMHGAEFLREAETMPLYRLLHLGHYPGLIVDLEDGLDIRGELWAVPVELLAKLDTFESVPDETFPRPQAAADVPSLFRRGDVAVRDCFETVQAYFWNGPIPHGIHTGSGWPLPE